MIKTIHRGLWLAAGLIFVLLGIIGLMLPVVPQIPFFLAAVLCFMRCSGRFSNWMEKKPWFVRFRARFPKKEVRS
ncbi:MAG: DUF454 family protein [Kiritimatiellaceae bacterium]|nr:DUF454 family protein [Kiritimatiellaceae bacterium]